MAGGYNNFKNRCNCKCSKLKTIILPCISTGEFRFPKKLASKIAIDTIKEYLDTNKEHFEKIIFNVFSDEIIKFI